MKCTPNAILRFGYSAFSESGASPPPFLPEYAHTQSEEVAGHMKSDFLIALTQLAAERGLPREIVLSAIEAALASAYKKDSITANQNVSVKLDPGSGDVTVHILKTVVEDVEDEHTEITLRDAKKIKPDAELGENVVTDSKPHNAGRIAAQTAKQVVMQRLREAEREIVFMEYADKEGEVFSVTVQRLESKHVIVDLGRAEAVLPPSEQVSVERYRVGTKLKVLLQRVERSSKGPELIVSRADNLLVKRLFETEVPEIFSGAVVIEAIAREPGSRSKVAVRATQDGVDPVGSCVGLRGVRIQNIVNELHGEKIDVVEWNKDLAVFIANALSPAQVMRVNLNLDDQTAMAVVPERQLSLAIGKEGQNARLAARLTGWRVDIKNNVEYEAEVEVLAKLKAEQAKAEPEVVEVEAEALVEAVASAEEPVVAEVKAEEAVAEPVVAELQEVTQAEVETEEVPVAELETTDEVEAVTEEVVEVVEEEVEIPAEVEKVTAEPVEAKREPEPVGAVPNERAGSLRDISSDVWSVRRSRRPAPDSSEPGQIRFAEDIEGLRGGVTASRRRRTDTNTVNADARRRKTKSGGGKRRR